VVRIAQQAAGLFFRPGTRTVVRSRLAEEMLVPNRQSRANLRRILAGERCVLMATVFDPVSARLAHALGYEAALVGGSIVSHAVLGAPDVIVLTLTGNHL